MKEKEDDEIVYIDEKSPVAISFEDLQKGLIKNIGFYFRDSFLQFLDL